MLIPSMDAGHGRLKCAIKRSSGAIQVIKNDDGEDTTPSVLHISSSGDVLCGNSAISHGYIDPDGVVREFKSSVGTDNNLLRDGRSCTPKEACGHCYAALKADCERETGVKISAAVLTCPAGWNDMQKAVLRAAAKEQGIDTTELIEEPVAAALLYGLKRGSFDRTFSVFDFGHGTFDVCVVRMNDPLTWEVLASDGTAVGGSDFNQALREIIKAESGTLDRETEHDLDERVELAKKRLGKQTEVPIVLPGFRRTVTQDEFHKAIEPLLYQAAQTARACIGDHKLDGILPVGGAMHLPFAREFFAKAFPGVPLLDGIDKSHAVAMGAAEYGVIASRERGGRAVDPLDGKEIPDAGGSLILKSPHFVGVACFIDSLGRSAGARLGTLIRKGDPVPVQRELKFRLERSNQQEAEVIILQGPEDAARFEDCLVIKTVVLRNLTPEPGIGLSERIHVRLEVSRSGMVGGWVRDIVTGQQEPISFEWNDLKGGAE